MDDEVHLWCFCPQATPYAKAAMFAFYTNQLHFSPEFLGRMQLMDGTAQLIGASNNIADQQVGRGESLSRELG